MSDSSMLEPGHPDGKTNWESPGAHRVTDKVYRIPLPLPIHGLRAVNVYAIVNGKTLVVIDSGMALVESERALETALGEIGYELGDVREFLVTHIHGDHFEQAIAMRSRFGSRVTLGEGERANLSYLADSSHNLRANDFAYMTYLGAKKVVAQLDLEGYAPHAKAEFYQEPDTWALDNSVIEIGEVTLTAINTPGHTRGHMVYFDPSAHLMFTGDHLLTQITPSIGFEPDRDKWALRSFLTSLRLLRQLPDVQILPAHGPVGESTHTRAFELILHHESRLEAIYSRVSEGAETAFDVAAELTWTRKERRFSDLDGFNQMLAVAEVQQHLYLLVDRGLLVSSDQSGISQFAAERSAESV